jgi:outer membrane receptor protein involved in Fe transport
VSLTASYTRLVTTLRSDDVNVDGNALPRTPGHLLYARGEVAQRLAGHASAVWLDALAQSTSFLDEANLQRVPGRVLLGAGARVAIAGGVAATVTVDNALDTRIVALPGDPVIHAPLADLAGYPLPGRSFYLTLEWTR